MAYVELKSVAGLSGKKFTVPLYQRGYRWEIQQVKDLLEDIAAFMVPDKNKESLDGSDSFYCLQPLAVKALVKDKKIFLEALPKSDTEDVLARTRAAISPALLIGLPMIPQMTLSTSITSDVQMRA